MATHWAILIGVGLAVETNDRISGQNEDRSVTGAVADVKAVKAFLLTASRPVDIVTLTTRSGPQDEHCNCTTESPDILPTRKNVLNALKNVATNCQDGDQVYIHFSGHGTRRPVPEHFDRPWDSVALVLFSDVAENREYLFGETLHKYLKMITGKGAYVILVLDCCFSGSVMRNNDHLHSLIRFLEYNSTAENQSTDSLSTEHIDIEAGEYRGASVSLNREQALDPKSYTILTACGLDEIAWECRLDDGTRMGAMTRFLLESLTALRNSGTRVSYRSLHQAICSRIHAQITHQTPMLYGSGESSFFDDLLVNHGIEFVPLYRNHDDERIVLAAGQAHGVQIGDTYAAYSFTAPERVDEAPYVRLTVRDSHCLTSCMSSIEHGGDKTIKRGSSWKAKLLIPNPALRAHVRLMPNTPCEVQQQLLAKTQGRFRFKFSRNEESESPSLYQVSITERDFFQIEDAASHRIIDIPSFSRSKDGSQDALIATLDHLIAYNTFQSLSNRQPDPLFENSFKCEASYRPGDDESPFFNIVPGPDRFFNIQDGKVFRVRFTNMGQKTLHLAMILLGSSWDIQNLLAPEGEGDVVSIPPRGNDGSEDTGEDVFPIRMSIDAERQQDWDILKVFVLSRPTSFPTIILPSLTEETVRGPKDTLQSVLDELLIGFSRTREDGSNWAVRDFYIRTSR